jgi:hypothetical protein
MNQTVSAQTVFHNNQVLGSLDPNYAYQGVFDYNLTTPYKASVGFALILKKAQKDKDDKKGSNLSGVITADFDYNDYRSIRFNTQSKSGIPGNIFQNTNQAIQSLGNTFGWAARVGGELAYDQLFVRAGASFAAGPLASTTYTILQAPFTSRASYSATTNVYSGGLGYRSKTFFADIAFQYHLNSDIRALYVMNGDPNNANNILGTSIPTRTSSAGEVIPQGSSPYFVTTQKMMSFVFTIGFKF